MMVVGERWLGSGWGVVCRWTVYSCGFEGNDLFGFSTFFSIRNLILNLLGENQLCGLKMWGINDFFLKICFLIVLGRKDEA